MSTRPRRRRALSRDFFARPTLDVARDLIGTRLVHEVDGVRATGIIVETEAYIGEDDPACHAAAGLTRRNGAALRPAGLRLRLLELRDALPAERGDRGGGASRGRADPRPRARGRARRDARSGAALAAHAARRRCGAVPRSGQPDARPRHHAAQNGADLCGASRCGSRRGRARRARSSGGRASASASASTRRGARRSPVIPRCRGRPHGRASACRLTVAHRLQRTCARPRWPQRSAGRGPLQRVAAHRRAASCLPDRGPESARVRAIRRRSWCSRPAP